MTEYRDISTKGHLSPESSSGDRGLGVNALDSQ